MVLEGFASVAAMGGEPLHAARLLGTAATLRETLRAVMGPASQAEVAPYVALVHSQLGETTFAAALAEGRAMPLERALEAAFAPPAPGPALADPSAEPRSSAPRTAPAGLTSREVEVLRLVAQGLTNDEVAERLIISPRTVAKHLEAIYGKLAVTSRTAAARFATTHQLV